MADQLVGLKPENAARRRSLLTGNDQTTLLAPWFAFSWGSTAITQIPPAGPNEPGGRPCVNSISAQQAMNFRIAECGALGHS